MHLSRTIEWYTNVGERKKYTNKAIKQNENISTNISQAQLLIDAQYTLII